MSRKFIVLPIWTKTCHGRAGRVVLIEIREEGELGFWEGGEDFMIFF
jgi:hypothetical protein